MKLLRHECGIMMEGLLKPLSYCMAVNGKLFSFFNKAYMFLGKVWNADAIPDISSVIYKQHERLSEGHLLYSKQCYLSFPKKCFRGHLRYYETGKSGLSYVHKNAASPNLVTGKVCSSHQNGENHPFLRK